MACRHSNRIRVPALLRPRENRRRPRSTAEILVGHEAPPRSRALSLTSRPDPLSRVARRPALCRDTRLPWQARAGASLRHDPVSFSWEPRPPLQGRNRSPVHTRMYFRRPRLPCRPRAPAARSSGLLRAEQPRNADVQLARDQSRDRRQVLARDLQAISQPVPDMGDDVVPGPPPPPRHGLLRDITSRPNRREAHSAHEIELQDQPRALLQARQRRPDGRLELTTKLAFEEQGLRVGAHGVDTGP